MADIHTRQKWNVVWPHLSKFPLAGVNLLDAGCGAGQWTLEIAARRPHWTVVGLDKDRIKLELAEKARRRLNLENVRFQWADLLQVDARTQYDVVLSVESSHYLAEAGRGEKLFENYASLLWDGGELIVLASRSREKAPVWAGLPKPPLHSVFSEKMITEYCKSAGLAIERLQPHLGAFAMAAKQVSIAVSSSTVGRLVAYPFELLLCFADDLPFVNKRNSSCSWLLTARKRQKLPGESEHSQRSLRHSPAPMKAPTGKTVAKTIVADRERTELVSDAANGLERPNGAVQLALLAPDGVGIRNFVMQSRFQKPVLILHHCPEQFLDRLMANGLGRNFMWQEMEGLEERPIPFALRQCLTYAHLYWGDTQAMRVTRGRTVGGSWRRRLADRTGRLVGRLTAQRAAIRALQWLHYRSVNNCREVTAYRRLFEQMRPPLLLSANHRIPSILPAVLAAKSCGIPTVSFIASWDNLTSKGRVAAPFDHYLVWSENMRRELLQFHPYISKDNVHVVGTPQFDIYADHQALWSRDEFFQRVGANPDRPLICYSGGDFGTCPDDQHHVRILLDLVRQGDIRGEPQVLLRPSPVDRFRRYDQVRRDYPELIYLEPEWARPANGDWSRCVPLPEDVQVLANLTYHCDMNVNVASTMTLDFGIRDKPVVNIAFDVTDPPPTGFPLCLYYEWEHYRPVTDLSAARVARSPKELSEQVNAYLSDPGLDREGRRRLVELQVGTPIGEAGARIADVLRRLVA